MVAKGVTNTVKRGMTHSDTCSCVVTAIAVTVVAAPLNVCEFPDAPDKYDRDIGDTLSHSLRMTRRRFEKSTSLHSNRETKRVYARE